MMAKVKISHNALISESFTVRRSGRTFCIVYVVVLNVNYIIIEVKLEVLYSTTNFFKLLCLSGQMD